MKGQIRKSVAQQIVQAVKDVSGHDVNFIDKSGVIFASTDPGRVGAFHEVGRQVVKTGQTIEVETDGSFFGTQKGVNIPFHYQLSGRADRRHRHQRGAGRGSEVRLSGPANHPADSAGAGAERAEQQRERPAQPHHPLSGYG